MSWNEIFMMQPDREKLTCLLLNYQYEGTQWQDQKTSFKDFREKLLHLMQENKSMWQLQNSENESMQTPQINLL